LAAARSGASVAQLLGACDTGLDQLLAQLQTLLAVLHLDACFGESKASPIEGEFAEQLQRLQASLQGIVQTLLAACGGGDQAQTREANGAVVDLLARFTHALLAAAAFAPVRPEEEQRQQQQQQSQQPFGGWNAWWQAISKLADGAAHTSDRSPLRTCIAAAILWDVAVATTSTEQQAQQQQQQQQLINLSTRPLLALLGMGIERSLGAAAVDSHASNDLLNRIDVLIGALGQIVRHGALFAPKVPKSSRLFACLLSRSPFLSG
jgi:hypothetical protein